MFASRVTKVIPTPSEPSYAVTVRRLSGRKLEKARLALVSGARELLEQIGGAGVFKEFQQFGGEAAFRKAAESAPKESYHKPTVLLAGIVTWRLESEPDSAAGERSAAEIEAMVDDLEQPVEDLLFREILALSRVAVTSVDAAAIKEAEKNG